MFKEEVEYHLKTVIIPYWMNLKDETYGGFYGYADPDNKIDKKAVKGCILNSRILWFFSSCAAILKDESYTEYAKWAYEFLKDHFIDEQNGGVYWSVTYDGKPEDDSKHTYNQAFAIYGLSAYYDLTGDKECRKIAEGLIDVIETKCRDKDGYLEAFKRDFTPASNEKLSENGVMAERTMNTLLHVFEAYTEYYRVTNDDCITEHLNEQLKIFKTKMYTQSKHRQEVFFDKDYNSLIDLISYGHDIETAWLIDRGIEVMASVDAGKIYDMEGMAHITEDLAENILHNAFDGHSLPQENENGVINEDRIWWVQAETVNGFLNEYLKHPQKEEFKEALLSEWEYIKEYVVDSREGSEWFASLHKDGTPYKDKPMVEPWKCPYHNGRMCLEVIRRNVGF